MEQEPPPSTDTAEHIVSWGEQNFAKKITAEQEIKKIQPNKLLIIHYMSFTLSAYRRDILQVFG